jgi:hypothetical protein
MNKAPRIRESLVCALLLLGGLNARPCQADASKAGHAAPVTRQQLIGAWQLQSIQLVGPHGSMNDPFYNDGSTGILIYERSGWMSVQIVGQHRESVDVPVSRPSSSGAEDARHKSAVLDSYYAYFGTWEFNEAKSTVTHHVVSSLYPSETGMSYSQSVNLDHKTLTLTTQRESAEGTVVQKKVWRRIRAAD